MTISKSTLTLSLPSSAGVTQRTRDLNGRLSAIHFRNVNFTSDVKISLWRSSSTHIRNRLANAPCLHGTTQWIYRPRFKVALATTMGSTGFLGNLASKSTAFAAMMEFADQPLVVRMSSHYTKTGVTCNLTVYMEN